MSNLLQFFRGWKNPTRDWQANPARELKLNLDEHRLSGVGIGDPVESLSFLGAATSWSYEWEFPNHGITLLADDHSLTEFSVFFGSPKALQYGCFAGAIIYRGSALELSAEYDEATVLSLFGEPYWRDVDDEETLLFYEFGDREWQIELDESGRLSCIGVGTPMLADPDLRAAYKVTKSWPPIE